MKKYCVVTNRQKDDGMVITDMVIRKLKTCGCEAYPVPRVSDDSGFDFSAVDKDTECCIVLGGDGTIIETVRGLYSKDICVVGFNLGSLGFLSIVEIDEIERAIDCLIADDFDIEQRMLMNVHVIHADPSVHEADHPAFSDVVVTRTGSLRVISVKAYVNDSLINTYTGDGVLVCTPTGSTGYNLSAGGPVVTPEAEMMVLTPICTHALFSKSIVVGHNDEISLTVEPRNVSGHNGVSATIDGRVSFDLAAGDRITVRRISQTVNLIRFRDKSFFKLLHTKLGE